MIIDTRLAMADEAEALHDLSIRSKAHWCYDTDFMALVTSKLHLREEWFLAGRVILAMVKGSIAGVVAVMPPDRALVSELEHLFVDPQAIGRGVGTALLEKAENLLRNENAKALRATSDPHAQTFYERRGFVKIGDAPSDAIPGRKLPILIKCLA